MTKLRAREKNKFTESVPGSGQDFVGMIERNRRRCSAKPRISRLRAGERLQQSGVWEWEVVFARALSAALSIPINDYLTITPELYCSFPLSSESDDLLTAASMDGDDDSSHLYGGVAASFSF